ncbi:MAG: serine/threonine-protein kinase [Fibrobacteria bacterium]
MKKTAPPPLLPRKGLNRLAELLPFSQTRSPGNRGVLRATRFPARPFHRGDSRAVTRSQFGRYQVLHKLGQGAMSAVFLARDPVLSRLVAVKVLHPDLTNHGTVLERFFKEAKTVSRLHSPHVVSIHDFGMEGNTPYLVMEFIDGLTLQKVMYQLQGEPMNPIVACAMMVQVLEGLAAASEWGIVHRDLKPENLMLSQKGYLKLADFGICHLKDHAMTATGEILGSPRFMSPEQVRGLKPITVQSDLFSLGAVFYYLLSGTPPFMKESKPELYRQIVSEPHPSLANLRSGLDRNLIRLVDTLLEKDPTRRGEGPAATALHLKKYLLKKKIVAPVERIGQYVRELNAAGLQTTSNLSPEQVRQWMGSLDLEKRPVRRAWQKPVLVALGAILLAGAFGGLFYFTSPRLQKETSKASLPADGLAVRAPMAPRQNPSPSTETRPSNPGAPSPPQEENQKKATSPAAKISPAASNVDAQDTPLQSIPSFLTISSVPPFADVFLDGYLFGRTPMENKRLPPGQYHLTLKNNLGQGVDTLVLIKPGPHSFRFVLLENPEAP